MLWGHPRFPRVSVPLAGRDKSRPYGCPQGTSLLVGRDKSRPYVYATWLCHKLQTQLSIYNKMGYWVHSIRYRFAGESAKVSLFQGAFDADDVFDLTQTALNAFDLVEGVTICSDFQGCCDNGFLERGMCDRGD